MRIPLVSPYRIRPNIEKWMPLLEALHARELLDQGGVQGRIVLVAAGDRSGKLTLSFGRDVPPTLNP